MGQARNIFRTHTDRRGTVLAIALDSPKCPPHSNLAQADEMQAATPEDVLGAAEKLGFIVPSGHEEDYLELLRRTDAACKTILAEPGEIVPGRTASGSCCRLQACGGL